MADKGRHSSAKNTNSFGFCGNRQTVLRLFCYVVGPCSKSYPQTSSGVSKGGHGVSNKMQTCQKCAYPTEHWGCQDSHAKPRENQPGRPRQTELRISRWPVEQILCNDLHMYLYKMTVVCELTACNVQQRLEFTVWAQHDEVIMHNAWFSEKAHFHLDSIVNKYNVCSPRKCITHRKLQYGLPSIAMD